MGLCNAPGTFMRVMDKIFGDQNLRTIVNYLDDLLVFGSTYQEMLERLDMVLTRLRRNNLKVKPEKCHLAKQKLRYLGHVVSAAGISPDPEKIRSVADWEEPKSEKELREFLGLTGYYHRFVAGYAKLAAPLHALTGGPNPKGHKTSRKRCNNLKDGQSFSERWSDKCKKAFEQLKVCLISAPILAYPDYSLPFLLETDASHQGLGAVLSQEQANGKVVIAYASRGLRKAEKNMENYSSMKLELLALK